MNPTFRQQKRQARAILHDVMSEVVIYIAMQGAELQTPTVRLQLKFKETGDLRRAGFAEQIEQTPKVIFLGSILVPSKASIIVTDSQGAYYLDRVNPPDDITVAADVSPLPVSKYEAWGLVPGEPWCGLPAPVPISELPVPQPPQYGTPPTWAEDDW